MLIARLDEAVSSCRYQDASAINQQQCEGKGRRDGPGNCKLPQKLSIVVSACIDSPFLQPDAPVQGKDEQDSGGRGS